MPSNVECPSCHRKFAVKPEYAGKRAKCKCGSVIVMPAAEPESLGEADLLEDEPAAPAEEAAPEEQDEYGLAGEAAAVPVAAAVVTGNACMNCQAQLPAGAVLCTTCGFNQQTRTVMKSQVVAGGVTKAGSGKGAPGGKAMTREQAVDQNQGMRGLKKFFKDNWDALDFYADRRGRSFTAGNAPSTCELCQKPAQQVRKFRWNCTKEKRTMDGVSAALTILTFASLFIGGTRAGIYTRRETKTFRFDSYHTVCLGCWSRHRTEMMIRKSVPWAVAAGVFLVAGVVFMVIGGPIVAVIGGGVMGVIGLIISGRILLMLVGTPRQLKFMGGGEFVLDGSDGME